MDTQSADGAYRVLARKYRPQNFDDLIGQEPMVRTLRNAFERGRIAQAWMLTGVRGVGKTTTARILARALNYKTDTVDQPTIDLSTPGEHCQAIMEGRHVDVIEMDAASHTGIDDIREIIEQVRYRPVSARYKVYIIDEVHMLSTAAFNGLLKTLEEPPPHVKFIFATTEIRKVPITVLSRCQRFDLRRIESGTLAQHLRRIAEAEKIEVDDASLAMIARAGEGSARDSLSIFDQAIAHGADSVTAEAVRSMLGLADRARIIDLFEMLMRGDVAGALTEFRAQYDVGADPSVVLTDLADFNHLVTRLRFTPDVAEDVSLSEDERVRGREFAQTLSIRALSRTWQMLLKGIAEVDTATRPVQAAEMLLIRLAHAADLPTLDEAIRGLDNGSVSAPRPQPSATPRPNGGSAPQAHGAADAVGSSALAPAAGGPATAMRIVETPPIQVSAPKPSEAAPQPSVPINSLQDIVALADKYRDMQFKILVKNCVRPASIAPGRLEIGLTDDAPKSLPSDIAQHLLNWTGIRWVVTVARDVAGQTIAEAEAERRDNLVTDARADPDVAAILAAFPGAKIIDVRIAVPDKSEDEDIDLDAVAEVPDVLPEDD
ncbi:DNA polymerase III, subunit gamma and tau [Brucella ovis IntaBari-2006-46-332]|uniref:DNA polymerase III subunit gamma/tau n=1 Tax=Brucella ovis (strain ATCC 25840 / 63/290 / NCTC 10512) TaxID=444178 RepID=A0A0H3AQC1_BRUO2|nr:DNA polymerase III subunit gamma/tau [Brucella ovis]ABQ60422.1 replication factor C conserved domain:ATP/GTP-binding site motif A [Brucella ovis ATCC 25840]ENR06006.1 DNA polymerase III, subunit gamma and tau [Brucella ovis 80/125]ENR10955.1 DNA polymerase III, subunit gamma and tau [Brucella ovis F8/05B]ENS96201.1 DNA polymerase III, subunit gamma and tau [Brucella ovis 63/96]ENT01784.1 DNA polymerase III, subunit gamma and tau [Brucella ovis 81/8]